MRGFAVRVVESVTFQSIQMSRKQSLVQNHEGFGALLVFLFALLRVGHDVLSRWI